MGSPRRPKCNIPAGELESALAAFGRSGLDLEEEREVRKLFPQHLFFHNEYGDDSGYDDSSTPHRICHCTACGESFEAVRANWPRGKMHHEPVNCPICGERVEALATYKYSYEMKSLERWVKTAILRTRPDGALLIEAGEARRSFNWDDLDGELSWRPQKRYFLHRGKVQMWEWREEGWSCDLSDQSPRWIPTKTVHEPFPPACMGYANYFGEYALIGIRRLSQSQVFRYSQIEDFYRYQFAAELSENVPCRYTIQYLAQYALHPQIEMAVKFGLCEAVETLIMDGKKNARYLDWDATSPTGFLRMDKRDARLFLKTGGSLYELMLWKDTCREMSLKEFWDMASVVGRKNLPALRDAAQLAGVGIRRAAGYMKSTSARYDEPDTTGLLQAWKDYLHMAGKLGYDLREETVAMPKDLLERHDAAADSIRLNESAMEMARYKARRHKLEKRYAFTLDGLSVLVPVSSAEIVQEGKTLHHCVGGYAARHIEGRTTILFLRKQRTPGRSFLTIELCEERGQIQIRQIHGYRNENITPRPVSPSVRYAGFLDAWLNWVNAGSQRDRNGKPVLEPANYEEVKSA